MTRPLLALLALALVGCSRPEPVTIAAPAWKFYSRSAVDSLPEGWRFQRGILVLVSGDTLHGLDSVYAKWPGKAAEASHDTTLIQVDYAESTPDSFWHHTWIRPNALPSDTLRGGR